MTYPNLKARTAVLALFLAGATALLGWYLLFAGVQPPGDRYRVDAVLPTAVNLASNADVRQAGVRIGEVVALRPDGTNGDATKVTLQVDEDHAPIYRDARVQVRAKTLNGENYIDVDPGDPRSGELPDGGRLPIDHAREVTQLDQIFSVFDEPRRRDLRRALDGLDEGLEGRGRDLNGLFEGSAAVIREGRPVTRTLAGHRFSTAAMVDNFGRVARALGDRGQAIRVLVRRSRTAAQAVAARDEQLRRTLEELPGFLRQSAGTARRLTRFSPGATPVLRDLRIATERLVPAMAELEPAATAGAKMMGELDRFAQAASPMLARLRPFARASERFVPPLAGFLRQANPLTEYLAPYAGDLGANIALGGAFAARRDDASHYARVGLLTEQDVAPFLKSRPRRNPYPAPGTFATPTPFSGDYPRLLAEPPYLGASR